jgi:RNA polymerase sigma factor (sigma-70 family)
VRSIGRDSQAFEAFYREHVDAVQRFVARRVGDPELVADLTAEVFVAAIESAHNYRPTCGSPAAWLFGVARNVVSSEYRRRERERRAVGRLQGRNLLDPDDVSRIDERIDAASDARKLYHAMDRLPEGQRAVLELIALDGLSVTEAAHTLAIQPLAARVRLHRARRVMREQLAALDESQLSALRHATDLTR